MRFDELDTFIITMYKESEEDKLQSIWRSNPFQDKSYNEWKKELTSKHASKTKPKELVVAEANLGMEQALSMLDSMGGVSNGG